MAKLLLEAKNIEKSFGAQQVLAVEGLSVYDGERIALIGENGAGKSTLLNILSGKMRPDAGYVHAGCEIALIAQQGTGGEDGMDRRIRGVFGAQKLRDGLSGGEQTRRRIAGALSQKAQLLFADEPTTDLDWQGIELLEKELRAHRGALVLISHDRGLISRLCDTIWHLQDGKISVFRGSYDAYMEKQRMDWQRQEFEYQAYREEQSRLRRAMQAQVEKASQVKKAPTRMGNSEARLHKRSYTDTQRRIQRVKGALESRLNHMEEVQRPRDLPDIRMLLGTGAQVMSRTAVRVGNMDLRAGEKTLARDVKIEIQTGFRTAILGENGCGKTTLLTHIATEKNGVRLSPGVKIGWFDQNHQNTLDMEKTALENVLDANNDRSLAQTVLARLNMRGDRVFKRCGVLSGGEKVKVALAKLMLSDANVLLLDEPTNHLDIFSAEALEDVLSQYGGTLVFVSHDRRFVEKLAQKICIFEGGRIRCFDGTYAQYTQKQAQDRTAEDKQIAISQLQMRMAELNGRLSMPRKGDDPQKLQAEFFDLAEKLRNLRKNGE